MCPASSTQSKLLVNILIKTEQRQRARKPDDMAAFNDRLVNRVTSMISKSLFSTTLLFYLICSQMNVSLIKQPLNFSCATVSVMSIRPKLNSYNSKTKNWYDSVWSQHKMPECHLLLL